MKLSAPTAPASSDGCRRSARVKNGGIAGGLFTAAVSAAHGAGYALARAVERLDREARRAVLIRGARERLGEELGVREVDLDDEPLARRIEMQPLDRSERRRVQQALGRLPGLLDILIEHAGRVVGRLDDEGVAVEMPDRMTERRACPVL